MLLQMNYNNTEYIDYQYEFFLNNYEFGLHDVVVN